MQRIHLAKRTVVVDEIIYNLLDKGVLTHCRLDLPAVGSLCETQILQVKGWIYPVTEEIDHIRLVCGHHIFDRDIEFSPRYDVWSHFQEDKVNCGFEFFVNVDALFTTLPLRIECVLQNGEAMHLCTIAFSIKAIQNTIFRGVQPCQLVSMDRSGSTFLMNLLEKHDSIVTYPQYPFEAWAIHYWMRMQLNLTAPLDVSTPGDSRFWSSKLDNYVSFHNRSLFGSYQQNQETLQWIGNNYALQVSEFSHNAIQSFYDEVAKINGKVKPRWFIEKVRPTLEALLHSNQRTENRHIILFRDFRDYTCSYLSFFGLAPYQNAEEMIIKKIAPTVWRFYECYLECRHRSLLLSYEELVLHTEKVLKKILEYLELPSSGTLISAMCEQTRADDRKVKKQHVTAKSTRNSIGRWKEDLSPELLKVLEAEIREPMGYFSSILEKENWDMRKI